MQQRQGNVAPEGRIGDFLQEIPEQRVVHAIVLRPEALAQQHFYIPAILKIPVEISPQAQVEPAILMRLIAKGFQDTLQIPDAMNHSVQAFGRSPLLQEIADLRIMDRCQERRLSLGVGCFHFVAFEHVCKLLAMLKRQSDHPQFSGKIFVMNSLSFDGVHRKMLEIEKRTDSLQPGFQLK
jgi:hypothetical protein